MPMPNRNVGCMVLNFCKFIQKKNNGQPKCFVATTAHGLISSAQAKRPATRIILSGNGRVERHLTSIIMVLLPSTMGPLLALLQRNIVLTGGLRTLTRLRGLRILAAAQTMELSVSLLPKLHEAWIRRGTLVHARLHQTFVASQQSWLVKLQFLP